MVKEKRGKRITIKCYATINPGPINFGLYAEKRLGWGKKDE